jgi:hypothetical protein
LLSFRNAVGKSYEGQRVGGEQNGDAAEHGIPKTAKY